MPSVSKTQQRLMGSAYAFATGQNKDVPETAKKVAKSFIESETKGKKTKKSKESAKKRAIKKLRDFAKTKHNDLPEKLSENKILRFSEFY
jgi:hypothetical protein